jgi:leucyl/phenylalanyl-tRNA--protein transferase
MIPINMLLDAYRMGFFPMAVDGRLDWYSPQDRGVLPLDQFHAPRRLRRLVRQRQFQVTINQDFSRVIEACASRLDDVGNWIDEEIIGSYYALHESGHAHSVEVWSEGALVGGLYGVSIRGAFFGESMFRSRTDASKVALCTLVDRLLARHYRLLDIQWLTRHLSQFGAVEISRREYLRRLAMAMEVDCRFVDPSPLDA